jgi:hypothetical protein
MDAGHSTTSEGAETEKQALPGGDGRGNLVLEVTWY